MSYYKDCHITNSIDYLLYMKLTVIAGALIETKSIEK